MCLDRDVHWVSKYMHLTQLMQADWVISTSIINEFKKKLANLGGNESMNLKKFICPLLN